MPCSGDDLSLGVPASFLVWISSDQGPRREWVHIRELVEERSGGLLPGGDSDSVWLRDLSNVIVSMLNQNRHY